MEIDLQARNEARQLLRQLSKRESEIATILTEGLSNKVAAQRLGLSVRTVEMHRGNALAKLGLRNILELTALWRTADIDPGMNESRGFNG